MRVRVWVAMVVLLLAGCAGVDGAGEDASARQACRHFAGLMADMELLDPGERRERLQQVHDSARGSDDEGLRSSAREALSAYTQERPVELESALSDLIDRCEL